MVCMFTLLSSLLLVSTTLATPSSLAEALLARGHEDRQSRSVNRVASRGPSVWAKKVARNWAGASIVDKTGLTFTSINGTIIVPLAPLKDLHDSHDENPVIWVGMDFHAGYLLQIGLTVKIRLGKPCYVAFYSWLPGPFIPIDDEFAVSPGDEFEASIRTHSTTSATVIFHQNTRTNQTDFVHQINGQCLLGQDVTWGVAFLVPEAFEQFSAVTINNAYAKDMTGNGYTANDVTTVTNLKLHDNTPLLTTIYPFGQLVTISRSGRN